MAQRIGLSVPVIRTGVNAALEAMDIEPQNSLDELQIALEQMRRVPDLNPQIEDVLELRLALYQLEEAFYQSSE